MRVEIASSVSDELVAAYATLTPQLSRSNPAPSREQLDEIVGSPATDLFVAYAADGTIVGTSTLAVFRIPTALRAWIEDVVVDANAHGQGVGEALTRAMVERAREPRLQYRRPHVPTRPGGREPPVPTRGLPAAGDQRLQVYRLDVVSEPPA